MDLLVLADTIGQVRWDVKIYSPWDHTHRDFISLPPIQNVAMLRLVKSWSWRSTSKNSSTLFKVASLLLVCSHSLADDCQDWWLWIIFTNFSWFTDDTIVRNPFNGKKTPWFYFCISGFHPFHKNVFENSVKIKMVNCLGFF